MNNRSMDQQTRRHFDHLYQLTMAQLYFRTGLHERMAQFDHFFHSYPNYGDHQAGNLLCLVTGASPGMGFPIVWVW